MIEKPVLDWWAVAPEVITGVAAIVVLLVGLMRPKVTRWLVPGLSLVALTAALVVTVWMFDEVSRNAWVGQIDSDPLANLARVLAAAAGIAAVIFSIGGRPSDGRGGEHHALILAAVCGMGLFAASGTLMTLFVGLELFSIALYALCALEAERVRSLEAGLKYLIVGGMSSAVLLYGAALAYGATGSLDLSAIGDAGSRGLLLYSGMALLLGGMAFKVSAAPLHWWTPDVYDGAPTTVTAFMAAATKAAAFVALVRVLLVAFPLESDAWVPLVAALATASIIVGNLAALAQVRLKRMLAYSSIAHAGYLLIGLVGWRQAGIAAVMYGLVIYVVMTLSAFALVLVLERRLHRAATYSDLHGLGWRGVPGASWLGALYGVSMFVVMLSLAGIPPTGGFFAKLNLFGAAVQADYAWLAIVGALGSVVSLVYYLRVPVAMYMSPADDTTHDAAGDHLEQADRADHGVVAGLGAVLALGVVLLGIFPGPVFDRACEVRYTAAFTAGADLQCGTAVDAADDAVAPVAGR